MREGQAPSLLLFTKMSKKSEEEVGKQMIEILIREVKCERVKLDDYKDIQFSYNSYGHLCIRLFNKSNKKETKIKDTLIVFTKEDTENIKKFLRMGDTGYGDR